MNQSLGMAQIVTHFSEAWRAIVKNVAFPVARAKQLQRDCSTPILAHRSILVVANVLLQNQFASLRQQWMQLGDDRAG
jgi:hypothetical protein